MRALIGVVVLFVPLLARAEDKDPVELTPQQVAQAITEKNVYVFDNTDSDSFKAAHVPHARLLHPGLYTSKDLPANKNATLIFYCYDKGWHAGEMGAGRAQDFGYKNVFVMPAGIIGWQEAGLPVEKGK